MNLDGIKYRPPVTCLNTANLTNCSFLDVQSSLRVCCLYCAPFRYRSKHAFISEPFCIFQQAAESRFPESSLAAACLFIVLGSAGAYRWRHFLLLWHFNTLPRTLHCHWFFNTGVFPFEQERVRLARGPVKCVVAQQNSRYAGFRDELKITLSKEYKDILKTCMIFSKFLRNSWYSSGIAKVDS